MNDLTSKIIERISSYNIFNNLFPGAVYCFLLKAFWHIDLFDENWLINILIIYFVGMILSRIGSLILEPTLKRVKFNKKPILIFSPYKEYKKASEKDSLLVTLSEVNNMYRTLLSCFVCLLFSKIAVIINGLLVKSKITYLQDNKDWMIIILLIILFAASYIKQSKYIKSRVESDK